MKKLFLILMTGIMTISCTGNKSVNSEGTSDAQSDEQTAVPIASETASASIAEHEEEQTIPDHFKVVAKYSNDNMSELDKITWDYTVTIICNDDGSATLETEVVETDINAKERKEAGLTDDDPTTVSKNQNEGSWKTIDVKRGTKYLTGYDVEIGQYEFYFTEKFDHMYGPRSEKFYRTRVIGQDEEAYFHFSDGKTSYAWKIVSFEKL